MLGRCQRKVLLREMKKALSLTAWTQEQVDGLERIISRMEVDRHIPDGPVGVWVASYVLGTDWHESGHRLTPVKEKGGRAYYIKMYGANTKRGQRLGNDTDEEAVAYSGKGEVQLTGENNYQRAEDELRKQYPDLIASFEARTGKTFDLTIGDQPNDTADADNALDPEISYAVLVLGMTQGWFGRPLGTFINEKKTDLVGARYSVNVQDQAERIAGYAHNIHAALSAAIAAAKEDEVALARGDGDASSTPVEPTTDAPEPPQEAPADTGQPVKPEAAQTGEAVVGGRPGIDASVEVTNTDKLWSMATSIPAKAYAAITAGTSLTVGTLSEWIGFAKENGGLILTLVICVGIFAVGIFLMHQRDKYKRQIQAQQFELEKMRLEIAANPKLYMVK
jgi:hypothetical protein